MWKLSKQQKNALKNAVLKYVERNGELPIQAEELPEFDAIQALHDGELFWQDANRFVSDLQEDNDVKTALNFKWAKG